MQERRRSLIANATFQLRWMLKVVLASFILINAVLIVAFLASGTGLSTPDDRLVLGIAVAATELVGMGFIFWLARRHSNRIAGPFYRVRQVAEGLARGDLTRHARVREGDFFGDEVASLELALETLRERVNGLQDSAARLRANQGDQESLRQLMERLDWFKTKAPEQ